MRRSRKGEKRQQYCRSVFSQFFRLVELPFCSCGCKNQVLRPDQKFLNGHNSYSNNPNTMSFIARFFLHIEKQYCACGCGKIVTLRGSKFKQGHEHHEYRNSPFIWFFRQIELPFCQCGCGRQVSDKRFKYCAGHEVVLYSQTPIETKTQEYLLSRGVSFLCNIWVLKHVNVDILIPDIRVVIECDGCRFHGCDIHPCGRSEQYRKEKQERDRIRTIKLEQSGYIVVHLWGHEIDSEDFNKLEFLWEKKKEICATN